MLHLQASFLQIYKGNKVLAVGIPAGGLATGAEEIKTMEERELFGGMANAPMDPCYHLYCDTIDNINQEVIGQMGKAAGSVLQTLVTMPNLRQFLNGNQ
jgi:hypothetical protein